jgi:hypothetical protein
VPPESWLDLPMSRLSNRMTRNPRSASCRQKLSSHLNHLRAEPHDEQHRLGIGVAENLIAKLDAIGANGLRRLVRERIHPWVPGKLSRELYAMVSRGAEGFHGT